MDNSEEGESDHKKDWNMNDLWAVGDDQFKKDMPLMAYDFHKGKVGH